jgi:uncharacterized protein (DUF433 family)
LTIYAALSNVSILAELGGSPRSKAIVLDPAVAFGKPIVTDAAVRTSILYDAFIAEGDKNFVAKLFEVPVAAVNAAVAFEESLAA